MSLLTYLREAPKAELHVHLEGSIRPQTVLELARRNGVTLPADDVAGLREWFRFRDFRHFIEVYVGCTKFLSTADDYALMVKRCGEQQAALNIKYTETVVTWALLPDHTDR